MRFMEKKQLLIISENKELSLSLEQEGSPFYSVITKEGIHAGFVTAQSYLPDVILIDYSSLGLESLKSLQNFKSNHFLKKSFLFLLGDKENKKILDSNFRGLVDGIIYDQVPQSRILDEIGRHVSNRKCLSNYWKDSFMGLFNILGNPVLLLENDRVVAMNDAFKRDFFITDRRQIKLSDLVEEKNRKKVRQTLRTFISGKHLKASTRTTLLKNDKLREAKIRFLKLDQGTGSQVIMMICFTGKEIPLDDRVGRELQEFDSHITESGIPEAFTKREKEIIALLCKGYKTKEISEALCISAKTIEKHRANIVKRTGSGTILESIVYALNRNMIEI